MEKFPEENAQNQPEIVEETEIEKDKKKPSKAGIAAAALGAAIGAGGPVTASAEQGDADSQRSSHEYVMQESERLANRGTAIVRQVARMLENESMPRLRAKEFAWTIIDMEPRDQVSKLLEALEKNQWKPGSEADAAGVVIDRLRQISDMSDSQKTDVYKETHRSLGYEDTNDKKDSDDDEGTSPFDYAPKDPGYWK